MIEPQTRRSQVGAWAIFDVANTLFWTGVVGLSFPLWVTKDINDIPPGMSGDDATLGYTLAATMAAVLLISPFLGAFSDQARRKLPFLMFTTTACVTATLLIGNGGLIVSLGIFAVALFTMELGVIMYNTLLAEVSTEANRGTIAGLGIGIGYVGAFIAVGTALVLAEPKGYVFVVRVLALLFLLFSLPIFLFLREQPKHVLASTTLTKITRSFQQLSSDLRGLRRFPGLSSFLIARFFYVLAISTATAFTVVYASQTVGIGDREIQLILLAGISVAIPSAIAWGKIVDHIGPKPVLTSTLLVWIGLLLVAVVIPWLSWPNHLWWIVGCCTGVAIAGVFTADRPFMMRFVPPQYVGEFFGLHAMVGKLGRVIGPFMWAFISVTLGLGQPAALLGLIGFLVIPYLLLKWLKAPVS